MIKKLNFKKSVKSVFSLMLAVILILSASPIQVWAADTDGSFAYYDDAKYWNANWKLWSQTSNDKPSSSYMRKYGCYVVAMSKLLVDSGAASSDKTKFNPGVFLKWEHKNGYISDGFYQKTKKVDGVTMNGATAYAKAQGKSLIYKSSSKRSQSDLLELLKTNYMIVGIRFDGKSGSAQHWIYVDRSKSLNSSKVYYMDYAGSQLAFSGTYAKYNIVNVYVYPASSSSAAASVTTTDIEEALYSLRSADGKYLSAASDKNGGAVNVSATASATTQEFKITKSGTSYAIASNASSSGRVVNVYSDNKSAAGMKVTLYDKTGDANQKWVFEKNGEGYIIHPSDNTGVAMTVQTDGSVTLAANSGATSQLWYLDTPESVIQAQQLEIEANPEHIEEPAEPEAIDGSEQDDDSSEQTTTGESVISENGEISLSATVTSVGVKFDWSPGDNKLGYRIFRSTSSQDEGISITDFPIIGNEYVDVNVKENTTYYYTIREVAGEASFDTATMELISEQLGQSSDPLMVNTTELITIPEVTKHFILMQVDEPMMRVDEETLEIDPGRGTTPRIINGRTLVPIRAIIESMGGLVDWEDSTQKVSLTANDHNVEMWIGNNDIIVDGEADSMDIAPMTINSRTMLPIRFVAESVGCQVDWIGSTQQIVVVFYLAE